ncbi:hypothetical protein N9118_13065 [Akkermansiaceae bacterium]|jgi:hypothetical protein|nr:hypothetical protein [Akkermansiaceae bacterium]
MKILTLSYLLLASATQATAQAPSSEVKNVPELSTTFLGGICGILFLLWRKK